MENLEFAKHILLSIQGTRWTETPWSRRLTSPEIVWSLTYVEFSFHPYAEFWLADTDGSRSWISFMADGVKGAGDLTDAVEKEAVMRAQRNPSYVARTNILRPFVHEELRKAGYTV